MIRLGSEWRALKPVRCAAPIRFERAGKSERACELENPRYFAGSGLRVPERAASPRSPSMRIPKSSPSCKNPT